VPTGSDEDVNLPGQLSRSTLGDLLGALYRADTNGTLELCEGSWPGSVTGRRHAIRLRCGLVRSVETEVEIASVGELLVQRGDAEQKAVRDALVRRSPDDARPTGELLVDEGLVDASQVKSALRAQLYEKLEALFCLRDALVAFRAPRPFCARAFEPEPLEPMDFLHRRPRRRPRANDAPARLPAHLAKRRALELLGLRQGASMADMKRALRRAALRLHPDRMGPSESAQSRSRQLARISAAYHLLTETP